MKVNIKEDKETCQIHVHIEVDPVVHDGTELGLQEAVYIGVPEVRAILAEKGVKVGRLLKRSTINSGYENACSGLWRFEMPEVPKKTVRQPKKTAATRKPRKAAAPAKKSNEKIESEV